MGFYLGMKRKDWQCTCGLPMKGWPWKGAGKRRGVVPQRCKPLQFSLECLSLGLYPRRPPPNRFRLKFLHSARPCAPLLPQRSAHTKGHSKRINTKSMGNSEKSKKKKEGNLLSNIIYTAWREEKWKEKKKRGAVVPFREGRRIGHKGRAHGKLQNRKWTQKKLFLLLWGHNQLH